jgi:hypothetical protein
MCVARRSSSRSVGKMNIGTFEIQWTVKSVKQHNARTGFTPKHNLFVVAFNMACVNGRGSNL